MCGRWSASNRRPPGFPRQLLTTQHLWKVKEKTSPFTSPYACFSQQWSCYAGVVLHGLAAGLGCFEKYSGGSTPMYETQVIDLGCRLGERAPTSEGQGCNMLGKIRLHSINPELWRAGKCES